MNASPSEAKGNGGAASGNVLEVGGRLECGPSERLIQGAFKQELDDQLLLFGAMNRVDLAHTLVMIESGSVPENFGRELLSGIARLDGEKESFKPKPELGDLYTNREAWLSDRGYPVGWLGLGRARREATTTAFHMNLREGLQNLMRALIGTTTGIVGKAKGHDLSLMPDYTYWQVAQPTTFGHYLLGFAFPMLRDLQRLQSLYGRVNRSPAGSGSVNGSRWPQHRRRLCDLLGFDDLVLHNRDAMWQCDLPIETAAVLVSILVNLDRLAEDWQIFATDAFGLIDFDDQHARASKIMPQKKNPFALAHVRGTANAMMGTLAACSAMGRTPSGQPDNRLRIYGLLPRAIDDAVTVVELLGEVVDHSAFNAVRARENLDAGFAMATDLADVLVAKVGLDYREAHRLVGSWVREHRQDGNFERMNPEFLASASEQVLGRRTELSDTELKEALDPVLAISARIGEGGAAPSRMSEMIMECETAITEAGDWLRDCRSKTDDSESLLRTAVDERLGLTSLSKDGVLHSPSSSE